MIMVRQQQQHLTVLCNDNGETTAASSECYAMIMVRQQQQHLTVLCNDTGETAAASSDGVM